MHFKLESAIWYGLKVLHFNALEYIHDVFSSLTASRSWLDGFPFLYDFRYGFTLQYHTYFFTAALAPFTVLLGVRGLFLAHAAVVWVVPLAVLWLLPDPIRRWWLLLLATLYWGPYGAWLFDDVRLGWHAELLFFPLSLLFAAALTTRRRWAVAVAGLLLVLVREDGPVIGCCLHLFALAVRHDLFAGWSLAQISRRLWPVVAVWFGLFAGLMALLLAQSLGHEVRVSAAMYAFSSASLLRQGYVLGKFLLEAVLLLLPFGALVWRGYGRRACLGWALAGLPLLGVALVAAALYPNATWYGISWAPRMAMLMGYALGGLILLLGNQAPKVRLSLARLFKLAAGLVVAQWLALAVVRDYNGLWRDVQTVRRVQYAPSGSPQRQLWALADRIPRRAYVVADYEFYAPFEWHRYLWLEEGHFQFAPVRQPDYIVTAAGSQMPFDWQQVPLAAYALERHGAVRVYRRCDFR